jgi:hypothetical protein
MKHKIRKAIAIAISPALAVTGFRFSKDYRWEVSKFHAAVYALVCTSSANWQAELLLAGPLRFITRIKKKA